ncbi:hypothetical protein KAM339_013270 [Aeromonas caviae]|uniref:hypothetical protein n=1 Tax=Aeromonas caviae TaxID=648 RepID=UPI00192191B3|nr:hypothetical protein [Aeromonas caviae]MBL0578970.1 hypothetical protein [Aeromonas caviae]BDA12786.1 hypothetical protein KAM339_013270 [Aeromonas caviae]
MRAWVLCLSLGLLSAGAQASVFKSECNLDKAARNEAMNAALGVKGNCDADKLVRQQKEKANAEVKKHTTDVLDKKTAGLKEAKKNATDTLDKKTSGLKETNEELKATRQKVNQTEKNVKAVTKDPVKAAATAVLNQE